MGGYDKILLFPSKNCSVDTLHPPQTPIFFDTLHEGGVEYFIGDSKKLINSVLKPKKERKSDSEIESQIHSDTITVTNIKEVTDFSQDSPIHVSTGSPLDLRFLEAYNVAKKRLIETSESKEYLKTNMERGDSLIEIQEEEPPYALIKKLPRTLNETGKHLYNTYYLVGPKTATSRVEKTCGPDRIAAFLRSIDVRTSRISREKKVGRNIS